MLLLPQLLVKLPILSSYTGYFSPTEGAAKFDLNIAIVAKAVAILIHFFKDPAVVCHTFLMIHYQVSPLYM